MHKNIFNSIIKTYHHPWLSYHIVILISHTHQSFYYNHVFMSYMAVIILLLPLVVQCLLFSVVTKSYCGLFLMVFVFWCRISDQIHHNSKSSALSESFASLMLHWENYATTKMIPLLLSNELLLYLLPNYKYNFF